MPKLATFIIAAVAAALVGAMGGCTPEHTTPTSAAAGKVEQSNASASQFHHWSRGDSQVDEWDFAKAVEVLGLFGAWDTNGDGLVSEDEFEAVVFQIWDEDDSGVIERGEWEQAASDWHRSQQPVGGFVDWDPDGDGQIGRDELRSGVLATHLFRYWDADDDGYLTQAEFAAEAFAVWDTNDNGMIERDEWERAVPQWTREFEPPSS
ncbi:MAG: EF-hand domain-containing protein [Persicimonas sp.]